MTLAVAMSIAAAVILYVSRGTFFQADELRLLYQTPDLDSLGEVLEPHNGHLLATTRLVFKAILETIGLEYLAFRLLAVGAILLSAGLFYALAKRRMGALPALAPTLVLVFLGSAWQHVVGTLGFTVVFSVAAGLASLLVLERKDGRGDIAACLLLVLSVATYTIGLAFLVGVAVSVLLRPDRRRRAWVFLVPLLLYAAWWLWSLSLAGSAEEQTQLSNVLLIPTWVFDSLAAAMAAVTGLGYNLDAGRPELGLELGRGWILAAAAVVALALRIRRGAVPASVWVFLAIPLSYWTFGALAADPESVVPRTPGEIRYVYVSAVGVLLVGAAALPPMRFSKRGLAILFAAAALSLGANLAFLGDGGTVYRDFAAKLRSQLAVLELARDHVDPNFDPPEADLVFEPASAYFGVVDRYGSAAYSLPELEKQSEDVREEADRALTSELELRLEPAEVGAVSRSCNTVRSEAPGAAIGVFLPLGGASLTAEGTAPATVTLGRFGLPTAEVGSLSPGVAAMLRIPPDASPKGWLSSVAGARSVEVCALR